MAGATAHAMFLHPERPPGGEVINDVYIEVAANELFGVGDGGLIKPPNADKSYTLSQADIAGKLC